VEVGYQPGISRSSKHNVVSLIGSVVNGGENIVAFQRGVISQDFLKGSSGSEQFQNVGNADALATKRLHNYKPKAPAGAPQSSPGWSAAEPWDIFAKNRHEPRRRRHEFRLL